MEMILALLVQDIYVVCPVQFVVYVNTQVFVLLHNLNVQTLDVHWCSFGSLQTEFDHHLLCLAGVDAQVVQFTPGDKVGDDPPILQIQLVGPVLVSRFRAPPTVPCVVGDGFQASPDLSGIVPCEALLQLPPVTVFASPYTPFQLFLHPPQLLLVPRFEKTLFFSLSRAFSSGVTQGLLLGKHWIVFPNIL